jgi:hypothetical protein
MSDDPLDVLAELGRATDELAPSDDFTDAVMQAVERDAPARPTKRKARVLTHPSWWDRVGRQGAGAMAVAAFAAAACMVLAVREQSTFDGDVLASIDIVEVAD